MMDAVDRRIVELLQNDGGLSISDLAEKIGMSAPPCWRRVKALKEGGVLKRQIWEVDAERLDLRIVIFATVQLLTHDSKATTSFRECIKDIPEVMECYVLLGSVDVLLKVVAPSISYYETFFYNVLSQLPAVREVTSSVVMSEVKRTQALPLGIRAS